MALTDRYVSPISSHKRIRRRELGTGLSYTGVRQQLCNIILKQITVEYEHPSLTISTFVMKTAFFKLLTMTNSHPSVVIGTPAPCPYAPSSGSLHLSADDGGRRIRGLGRLPTVGGHTGPNKGFIPLTRA